MSIIALLVSQWISNFKAYPIAFAAIGIVASSIIVFRNRKKIKKEELLYYVLSLIAMSVVMGLIIIFE